MNFNYSLDERAISYIKDNVNDPRLFDINSWTNIHGIATYKDQTAIKKINNLHGVTKQQNFLNYLLLFLESTIMILYKKMKIWTIQELFLLSLLG